MAAEDSGDFAADLSSFIEAGNTQPGGFYQGGSTARGGFNRFANLDDDDDEPDEKPSCAHGQHKSRVISRIRSPASPLLCADLNRPNYAAASQLAGSGQPAPFMGDATTKLYLSFVNDLVDDNVKATQEEIVPPPEPTGPKKWEINDEMMHQSWGAVLRTLQPSASRNNALNNAPPSVRRPNQAPAYLSGKAYVSGGGQSPRLGFAGNGQLSARPSFPIKRLGM